MTIPVYKAELNDGLADCIKSQATVAFLSQLKLIEPTPEQKTATIKAVSGQIPQLVNLSENQWDLHLLHSILASIGWNSNDDIFDAGETWAARNSPVFKQVNYMHNEKDIIGNIIASIVVDPQGNQIKDDTESTPEFFDILVASVLYKKWEDPTLQKRMDDLIEGIQKGDWFVSMECLFRNFDYGLVTPSGEHKVIARNSDSAFLTKHLRAYKGTGEYQGNKIGRLLRNFTFSGKGIVKNPANKRSVILSDLAKSEKTVVVFDDIVNFTQSNNEEKIMAETNDAVLQNLREELAKATARSDKLEKKLEDMVEEARKAEHDKFEKEIASLKVDVEDLTKKLTTQKAELDARDSSVKDLEKQIKEANEKLAEANKKLEVSKIEAIKAARIAKLVSVGVESAEATKVADKWASSTDEQFEDIVVLHKKDDKKVDETETEAEAEAAKKAADKKKKDQKVGDMEMAQCEKDVAGAIDNDNDTSELIKSTAAILGSMLHPEDEDEE